MPYRSASVPKELRDLFRRSGAKAAHHALHNAPVHAVVIPVVETRDEAEETHDPGG